MLIMERLMLVIWHLNIEAAFRICHNIIKNKYIHHKQLYTPKTIKIHIIYIFGCN
jgi:ubiquitin-protein ligase